MFVTFEGLDFSGKSTQARLVVERLSNLRIDDRGGRHVVRFIREPGGTPISERIRMILLDRNHPEMSEAAELLLFSASRAQLVEEVIRPALGRGEIVICDRFYDSTAAYQGYGRGLSLDMIHRVKEIATGGTEPDLTYFLDIPVDEIERRKKTAGLAFDRMEQSGKEFYKRVRNGYLALAQGEPQRFVVVDGTQPVAAIEAEIWRTLAQKLVPLQQSSL